jgi:hypothetical protein
LPLFGLNNFNDADNYTTFFGSIAKRPVNNPEKAVIFAADPSLFSPPNAATYFI